MKYKVNKDAEAYAEKKWENELTFYQFDDNQKEALVDSLTNLVKDSIRRGNREEIAKIVGASSQEKLETFIAQENIDVQAKVDEKIADLESLSNPSAEYKNEKIEGYKTYYKDSLRKSKDNVFLVWDYEEVEQQSISLGLDLQGGLAITLVVDKADALTKLATSTKTSEIQEIVKKTDEEFESSNADDYLTVFQKVFEEEKDDPMGGYFNTDRLSSISNSSSNNEVIAVLREEIGLMLDGAETILKTRIDQYGVASPEISKDQDQGHIYMELAGADNPERVKRLIEQSAELGFFNVVQPRTKFDDNKTYAFFKFIEPIDIELKSRNPSLAQDTAYVLAPLFTNENEPLSGYPNTAFVSENLAELDAILADKEFMSRITQNSYSIFRDKEPFNADQENALQKEEAFYGIYIVEGSTSQISGEELTKAYQFLDPMNNEPAVNLSMNSKKVQKHGQQ